MKRLLIQDTIHHIGKKVHLNGWAKVIYNS